MRSSMSMASGVRVDTDQQRAPLHWRLARALVRFGKACLPRVAAGYRQRCSLTGHTSVRKAVEIAIQEGHQVFCFQPGELRVVAVVPARHFLLQCRKRLDLGAPRQVQLGAVAAEASRMQYGAARGVAGGESAEGKERARQRNGPPDPLCPYGLLPPDCVPPAGSRSCKPRTRARSRTSRVWSLRTFSSSA